MTAFANHSNRWCIIAIYDLFKIKRNSEFKVHLKKEYKWKSKIPEIGIKPTYVYVSQNLFIDYCKYI